VQGLHSHKTTQGQHQITSPTRTRDIRTPVRQPEIALTDQIERRLSMLLSYSYNISKPNARVKLYKH